jgi:hypothetical protein
MAWRVIFRVSAPPRYAREPAVTKTKRILATLAVAGTLIGVPAATVAASAGTAVAATYTPDTHFYI